MLQHNPFGPHLRLASFEETLKQYTKKLNELEPNVSSESVLDALALGSDAGSGNESGEVAEDQADVPKEQNDSLTDSCMPQEDEQSTQMEGSVPHVGNLEQTMTLIALLEAGLRFSKCISTTMPTLVQLMASSLATDVENTILLLMWCKQFHIDRSEASLRKMLPLVSALWDYFCFNVTGTSAGRGCGAVSELYMAAKSLANVLSSHLHDIIDI